MPIHTERKVAAWPLPALPTNTAVLLLDSFQGPDSPSAPGLFPKNEKRVEATSGVCTGLGFAYSPSLSLLPHYSRMLPMGWN